MTETQKTSRALHILLWIAQVIVAAGFIFGGVVKLFQPIEKLSAMWPWTGEVPVALTRLTGIIDLVGVTGLIVPSLLRYKPNLTPIAAACIVVLMLCASIFHIARGEASQIGVNIFFALMAAFIAWGRTKKASIPSR